MRARAAVSPWGCLAWLVIVGTGASMAARVRAQELSVEPEEPQPDPDALKFVWEARVMTGFELERERPSSEQNGEPETDYGFFLSQARLGLEAEWGDLDLDISADLGDAIRPRTSAAAFNKPPYLRNAYINYRFHKAFRVRAGRFKRPFSGLELTSSGKLPYRGRGLANDLIVEDAQWGDRALGVMLWGRLPGKVRWSASVSNPSWAPDGDVEANGIDVFARAEWEPIKAIELGASVGHKLEARTSRDVHGNAASIDATLKLAGLRIAFDAMIAELTREAVQGADVPTAYAVTGYASYQIPLGGDYALEPALLGEYAEANAEYSRTEAVRMVAGLNFRVAERLRIMPQVDIVRPLGTAAAINPWQSSETYYVMLVAEF